MLQKIGILLLLFASCNRNESQTGVQAPPDISVQSNDTALHRANGVWMYRNKTFSGYIIESIGDTVAGKLPVVNGKEHGTAFGWYSNRHKRYERNFVNGNREGVHKGWYANDTLSFVYVFANDKFEGLQQTFFESGNKWQQLNYRNGYEEGKQRTWNDSGRVVNNFTVKNGKLYGVIGRYDCMSVMGK